MNYETVILASAAREYESIVAYLANILNSPQAAAGFMESFDKAAKRAGDNPYQFPLSRMPELAERAYRSFLVGSYMALFKVEDQRVLISHIVHQSQDYARLV